MKIIVTGASGAIGRDLVPMLARAGAELCLIGRSVDRLKALFPNHSCTHYDELEDVGQDADMLVHLAEVKSSSAGSPEYVVRENIDFALDVCEQAKRANVAKFVTMSSVQVLSGSSEDPYVAGKRQMERALAKISGIAISILHLPPVHGSGCPDKRSWPNRVPALIRRGVFACRAALKPTLTIDHLSNHILKGAESAIVSDGQARSWVFQTVKWGLDIAFAVFTLLFLSWLLVLLWLGVRLGSPGPGIFAQERLGKGGKVFTLYKFRTMSQDTKSVGTHEVSAASVTKLGGFLRKSKFDELPQVVNILRGEISMIGPRPGLPNQIELKTAREAHGVFDVRPGITGLAQIDGIDMSTPEKLAMRDAEYIALQGLIPELKIALATVIGKGGGDRVVQDS